MCIGQAKAGTKPKSPLGSLGDLGLTVRWPDLSLNRHHLGFGWSFWFYSSPRKQKTDDSIGVNLKPSSKAKLGPPLNKNAKTVKVNVLVNPSEC